MEADNRQIIRRFHCNVSVSGQQLLATDTQLQIKRILMGERSAPISRTGKQTGRRSQAGGLRSALFHAKSPLGTLVHPEIPPDTKR